MDRPGGLSVSSGTYRCDVQDTSHRRVKRIYWGIRVLPVGILNLDYDSSVEQGNSTDIQQEQSGTDGQDILLHTVRFGFISWAPLICDMSVMVGVYPTATGWTEPRCCRGWTRPAGLALPT